MNQNDVEKIKTMIVEIKAMLHSLTDEINSIPGVSCTFYGLTIEIDTYDPNQTEDDIPF